MLDAQTIAATVPPTPARVRVHNLPAPLRGWDVIESPEMVDL